MYWTLIYGRVQSTESNPVQHALGYSGLESTTTRLHHKMGPLFSKSMLCKVSVIRSLILSKTKFSSSKGKEIKWQLCHMEWKKNS